MTKRLSDQTTHYLNQTEQQQHNPTQQPILYGHVVGIEGQEMAAIARASIAW